MSALQSALDFPLSGYRKLWAFPPAYSQAAPEHNRQSSSYKSEFTLGSDLLVVLAAFFCALICAPGLNALLKWALRCSRRRVSNSSDYEVDISLGNAGLKEEAMTALPVIICTATSNPPAMSMDCPICLTEFTVGEKLRLIPQCSHGFHIECIDQWLLSHSSCPVCRRCLNLHSENKMSVGAVIDEVIESNSAMHIVID